MAKGISPTINVGSTVVIFGIKAVVIESVPNSDYSWKVTLSAINGGGAAETFAIVLPTDYETTTGDFAWQ